MMFVVGIVLCLAVGTHALSGGAPEAACPAMVPGHTGNSPQTTSSPYSVEAVMAQNGNDVTAQVTISAAITYKGFLLIGRDEGVPNTEYTGTFTAWPQNAQTVCGQAQGVTHTSSADKSNYTFTWTAPSWYCGNVTFRATVVQVFTTFWTGIPSNSIAIPCNGNRNGITTTTQAPTTTNANGGGGGGNQGNSAQGIRVTVALLFQCLTMVLLCLMKL